MKRILNIAFTDLKIMIKDKIFFFWTLILPLLFIFIFGNLYKEESTNVKASLSIINKDIGRWGDYLIKKLESPNIIINSIKEEPKNYYRILIIPKDFSHNLKNLKPQKLLFKKKSTANVRAAAQIETKLFQSIIRIITELVINSGTDNFFKNNIQFKDLIKIKPININEGLTKTPSGFDHVIPGTLVQFIMMMVLIYGGIVVMMDRQRGILLRILYSSTSISELWAGKFLGRFFMGLFQAFILIFVGLLFFNLNLGNNLLSFLIIIFFSVTIASLSILIGSVLNKEDLIVGFSVLAANLFAALGGCWWPIEVVPQTFKTIGMISPAYWAMDGFHKIIFFNKGLSEITINLLVLTLYTLVFTVLSISFFKIKE